MRIPRLVGPAASGTEAAPRGRDLPNDILQQASRRLSITALLMSLLYAVGWVLDRAAMWEMARGGPGWTRLDGGDAVLVSSVALSLSLYFHARRTDRDPRLILDIGLAYLVATAFGLALLRQWSPAAQGAPVIPAITWIGPIMLIFAAILPSTGGKMLVAGLLSVSMNPLSMMLAKARGVWDYGPDHRSLLMHYPNFLLVPAAIVISRVVRGLGQDVAKAREMGSYRLGDRIGLGAMGEVYRATHRMFARAAAIKLIRPDTVDPGDTNAAALAEGRFRREAEAAAQLRSPHTVALYDFGVTGDQTLYLVMELLDGLDLQSLVRDYGPLPANRVIYILRQVCDSLEEAHASGLVHRDIKPANIHLGRVGLKYDFAKVLDFGLVKSLDGDSGLESQGAQNGRTPGTPAYMAPEVVRGEPVDGRADLYALGCVAYYLLTGEIVFEADASLKMIASHLQSTPVRPSLRAAVSVPEALEDLVLRCLEKDPDDRPAGADEVGSALKAIVVEPWTQSEARAWWLARARQGGAPTDATPVPHVE